MSQELSLSMSMSKEYAVKKPQTPPRKPLEENMVVSQGMRESGVEWFENDQSEVSLSKGISENTLLDFTSTTDTSARVARRGAPEMESKFKKLFVSAYSNIFSHNRLLAKVSEWMVGNVMERLALIGMSIEELEGLKSQVRQDLIVQNRTAMSQVLYDETMLEIIG